MNVKNLALGTVMALSTTVAATAQDEGNADATQSAGADTVVATVGGKDITLGHMVALRERLPEQYRQLPDDALFEGILTQLINQEALSTQVEGADQRTELVLENERRAMLANSVLQGVAEEAVTDAAIDAAYEEKYGDADPTTEWNAAHILSETEEDAAAIKSELDEGGDFAELAREHSTGPSAPNGGALGWFGAGMMVPEFEQAVGGLQPGEVSEPFQTQFGWHVAKLNEVRDQPPPQLEQVRDQIVEQLQQEAIEAAVADATEGVDIVRPDLSGMDPGLLSDSALID
jgi:peptidyl-prolyl cis-trans isomerase C